MNSTKEKSKWNGRVRRLFSELEEITGSEKTVHHDIDLKNTPMRPKLI